MTNQSMKDAAKELHSKSNAADNDLINCDISCDGIDRRKGGHSSLNRCVAAISMDRDSIGC